MIDTFQTYKWLRNAFWNSREKKLCPVGYLILERSDGGKKWAT